MKLIFFVSLRKLIILSTIMVMMAVIHLSWLYDRDPPVVDPKASKLRRTDESSESCFSTPSSSSMAFVTLLAGNQPGYLEGACKLARTLRKHWHRQESFDALVMELSTEPLTVESKDFLRACGWNVCHIPFIQVLNGNNDTKSRRLQNCYSKLHAWHLLQYKRVVMLDADMLAVDDISELSNISLQDHSIAAVRDYWDGQFAPSFNGGMLVFEPSATTHKELLTRLKLATTEDLKYFEQSFLNIVFQNDWLELPGIWAANADLYCRDYERWKRWEPDIKIIHYTVGKPWNSVLDNIWVFELRDWWHQERRISASPASRAVFDSFMSLRSFLESNKLS